MGRPEFVEVGVFERPHGVRGEATFRRFSPDDDFPYRSLTTETGIYLVRGTRRKRDRWLLTLEGITDRDQAAGLTGQIARVERSQLPDLPPGGFYFCDLPGLQVVSIHDHQPVGVISEVLTLADQDYLELEGGKLIPFADPLVESVDLDQGRVVMTVPRGLP